MFCHQLLVDRFSNLWCFKREKPRRGHSASWCPCLTDGLDLHGVCVGVVNQPIPVSQIMGKGAGRKTGRQLQRN